MFGVIWQYGIPSAEVDSLVLLCYHYWSNQNTCCYYAVAMAVLLFLIGMFCHRDLLYCERRQRHFGSVHLTGVNKKTNPYQLQ